jgi:hypothetical protein
MKEGSSICNSALQQIARWAGVGLHCNMADMYNNTHQAAHWATGVVLQLRTMWEANTQKHIQAVSLQLGKCTKGNERACHPAHSSNTAPTKQEHTIRQKVAQLMVAHLLTRMLM